MTLTVTAVPFWILITRTSGFFGSGSRDLRNPRSGIPYMQPHSFTTKHPDQSFLSFLPGLSFAGIFEDKGDVDLTSEMRFESFSDLGRDHFLLSALHCIQFIALDRSPCLLSLSFPDREYTHVKIVEVH